MTRHNLPHSHPLQSKDNHVTADDKDANQTSAAAVWFSMRSDLDLNKSKHRHIRYNQQLNGAALLLLFRHARIEKNIHCTVKHSGWERKMVEDFLSLQPPHKAVTICRHPIGLTEVDTHSQQDVKDKES